MDHYRVFKSDRGEFYVDPIDDDDDFVASFDGKKWVAGFNFNAYAAQELLLVSDPAEAKAIVAQAKKQLGKKPAVA